MASLRTRFLLLYISAICITSVTLYQRSVSNDFLDLDDMTIVVKNYPFLKSKDVMHSVSTAFKQGVFQLQGITDTLPSYYRPIMTLSFMLDAHLSPTVSDIPKPKPFLWANIIYHTLACILLFLLLLEFKIPPLTAFLLSMIFTVHPLLNQAVAWIPGRNDSLLAIFIISSFIFLLKYIDSGKMLMLLLHTLFFLLALFTKENALMFIPLSLFYVVVIKKKPFKGEHFAFLAFVYIYVCITPWYLLRQHALETNGSGVQAGDAINHLWHNAPYILQYAGNAILPFALSVMSTPTDTNYILALAGVLIVVAGLFFSKQKRNDLVIFGLLWFILFLTPSLFSSFSGLEHRTYVPMIGVVLIASQIDWFKNASYRKGKIGLGLLIGLFLLFFSFSVSHLHIFENRFNLDKSAMETSPKSVLPCLYLGQHYDEVGQYDSAITAYREALKRDSTLPMIRSNIAGDYIKMNDYPDAESELRKDKAIHPKSSITVFDLGLVILQSSLNDADTVQKQKEIEAVMLWKKSIELDSGFVKPYNVLRQYYQATGDSENTILYRNLYLKIMSRK